MLLISEYIRECRVSERGPVSRRLAEVAGVCGVRARTNGPRHNFLLHCSVQAMLRVGAHHTSIYTGITISFP